MAQSQVWRSSLGLHEVVELFDAGIKQLVTRAQIDGLIPFISNALLQVRYDADCIQLMLVDSQGKAYVHPTFMTRLDLERGIEYDLLWFRFKSAAHGRPSMYPRDATMLPMPPFTLDELHDAATLIDSLSTGVSQ